MLTGKTAFPKQYSQEQDGWKITIKCKGIFTEFVPMVAQAGHPKGTVTLEGPDNMSVSIGTGRRMCPLCLSRATQISVNLAHGDQLTRQLGEELRNKYNCEIDWQFLLALGKRVFKLYDPYL